MHKYLVMVKLYENQNGEQVAIDEKPIEVKTQNGIEATFKALEIARDKYGQIYATAVSSVEKVE